MEYVEESEQKRQKLVNKKVDKLYRRYKKEVPDGVHNNLKLIAVGLVQILMYQLSAEETHRLINGVQFNIDSLQEALNTITSTIEENNLYTEEE